MKTLLHTSLVVKSYFCCCIYRDALVIQPPPDYFHVHASPSSGEAFKDRRLTTNFELWVDFFLCADMFPYEDSKTVSVCPYPEKRNHPDALVIQPPPDYFHVHASPSSGEAFKDRRLTTNFELWVDFFCVQTCFHMRIPKPCLSVRTPRKEIILASSISVLH